jgi:hypothetical protein
MVPVKRFSDSNKLSILFSLFNAKGTVPFKKLVCKVRYVILLGSSSGTSPVKLL